MTDRKVLIDTSAWVDFLGSTHGKIGDLVALAIERNQAALCGIVIAELLQGARGSEAKKQLDFLFSNIETLSMADTVMLKAGIKLQQLRSDGIEIPVTDALIAAVAREHDVPVLTLDKRFQHLDVERIEL